MSTHPTSSSAVKIIECPRDAMQGLHDFIPTEVKMAYAQQLLSCGFDTLDVGSFVSPKAIPQLKDTSKVLAGLDMSATDTELLVIVANERGAKEAVAEEKVTYLGFPFSISETFLARNINSSIDDSLRRLDTISSLAANADKKMVVYISMGFGNPYGEPWDVEIVMKWCHRLADDYGVRIINLSDTIGSSKPQSIRYLYKNLIPELPQVELGAHLHTTPDKWEEKIHAAYESGCRRYDSAIGGYGGCPMAADDLTGNMPTEQMLGYFAKKEIVTGVDMDAFAEARQRSVSVFP